MLRTLFDIMDTPNATRREALCAVATASLVGYSSFAESDADASVWGAGTWRTVGWEG